MSELITVIAFDLRYVAGSSVIAALYCSKYYRSWFCSVLYICMPFPSLVGVLLPVSVLSWVI
jgi:hypothetical protein